MLSKCFPCLLKTKWLSLDFGIIKCSWTSSPSIEDENVNACRVESDTCIKNLKKKKKKMERDLKAGNGQGTYDQAGCGCGSG